MILFAFIGNKKVSVLVSVLFSTKKNLHRSFKMKKKKRKAQTPQEIKDRERDPKDTLCWSKIKENGVRAKPTMWRTCKRERKQRMRKKEYKRELKHSRKKVRAK